MESVEKGALLVYQPRFVLRPLDHRVYSATLCGTTGFQRFIKTLAKGPALRRAFRFAPSPESSSLTSVDQEPG